MITRIERGKEGEEARLHCDLTEYDLVKRKVNNGSTTLLNGWDV